MILVSKQMLCSKDVYFFLRAQNAGTFDESGKLVLEYDLNTPFVSASLSPDSIDVLNHKIIWNFEELNPFQSWDIEVIFAMPDQNSIGLVPAYSAELYRDSMGVDVLLDSYEYNPVVLSSLTTNKLILLA